MNKNILLIIVSALILAVAIIFDITAKNEYKHKVIDIKKEAHEIKEVAKLQNLWSGRGVKSKLERVIRTLPSNKKSNIEFKRTKAKLSFVNLTDRELNRILGRLASLPVRFKNLTIKRVNENFNLECLCVW